MSFLLSLFLSRELVYSAQPEGRACRLCSCIENLFTVYNLKVEPVVFILIEILESPLPHPLQLLTPLHLIVCLQQQQQKCFSWKLCVGNFSFYFLSICSVLLNLFLKVVFISLNKQIKNEFIRQDNLKYSIPQNKFYISYLSVFLLTLFI